MTLENQDFAASTCPGGCGVDDACGCYAEGYVDEKGKAHFEIREMTVDHDWPECGCEPCITIRAVLQRSGVAVLTPAERTIRSVIARGPQNRG